MNWRIVIAVFYLLLSAILWLLGTIIVRENPRKRVNRVTGLMLFFGGLGPLFAAIGTRIDPALAATSGTSHPYSNLLYLWELFFPQLLLFAFVFPREHPWIKRFRRAKYLIFAPHVFHFLWIMFFPRPSPGAWEIPAQAGLLQNIVVPVNLILSFSGFLLAALFEFHLKFFSLINLAYIIAAVAALRHGYRLLDNPRLRNQVRVVIGGILPAVGLYTLAFIAPALGLFHLPGEMRVALTILALLIGSAAIAWAIIRYQFLDTRFIVRQSLVFSISSAVLLGGYLFLVTRASKFLHDILNIRTPLIDIGFVILVLLLFQPVKNRVDDLIQRLMLRDKADPRAILESFSREIASVFDVDDLKQQMVALLTDQMFVERAFFAVRDPSGSGFTLELSGLPKEPFPADDPFFREIAQRGRPAPFEEFVIERDHTPTTEVLSRWGCRLVVPITDRGELSMVLFLSEKASGYRYSVEDLQLFSTLANQLAVALTNALLYREALEKQKLEEELHVARQIQLQLLPQEVPAGDDFALAAFSHPSRQVGGDYYDFFALPEGHLGIVIADISGKGIGAALLVSQLQAILRSEVRRRHSMAQVVANTNVLIAESTAPDRFATLVYAEFDPLRRCLTYCNAGHNYPLVIRCDGRVENLVTGGLILGVSRSARYETASVFLNDDDVVLFYTDGISELENPAGVQFGEQRLLEVVAAHRHLSPDDLKNKLIREVTRFSLGAIDFDDMTMVILKLGGGRSTSSPQPDRAQL